MSKSYSYTEMSDRLHELGSRFNRMRQNDIHGNPHQHINVAPGLAADYLQILRDVPTMEAARSIDRPMVVDEVFLRFSNVLYDSYTDGEFTEKHVGNRWAMVRNEIRTESGDDFYRQQRRPQQVALVQTIYAESNAIIDAAQHDPILQVRLIGATMNLIDNAYGMLGFDAMQEVATPDDILTLQTRALALVQDEARVDNAGDMAKELNNGRAFSASLLSFAQRDRHQSPYGDKIEPLLQNEEKMNATVFSIVQRLPDKDALDLLPYLKPQGNMLKKKIWRQKRKNLDAVHEPRKIFQLSLQYPSLDFENYEIATHAMKQIDVTNGPYDILGDLRGRYSSAPLFSATNLNKPQERMSYSSLVATVMAHNSLVAAHDKTTGTNVHDYMKSMHEDLHQCLNWHHHGAQPDYYMNKQYAMKNLVEMHQKHAVNTDEQLTAIEPEMIPFDDFAAITQTVPGKAWLLSIAGDVKDAAMAVTDATSVPDRKRLANLVAAVSSVLPDEQKADFTAALASSNTQDITSGADTRRDQFANNNDMAGQIAEQTLNPTAKNVAKPS